MKKSCRIVSLICLLAMLLASFSILASASDTYQYETPVKASLWETPKFSTDHAYSIAFVGDTQYIVSGDRFIGTKKLNQVYKYIADTAEERKLEHVFVLGDITDHGYRNDRNLAGAHNEPYVTTEWDIAKEAISQLDGKVTYSLCRGNHDDYMIDDYFNVPEYTDQFKDCGGFFSDSDGKHPGNREIIENREGYIYWSAKSGYHENSIVNSWKKAEIYGNKYLFITLDYNPTKDVFTWLDGLLSEYPDHKAIITTHSYLTSGGELCESEEGNTVWPMGYTAKVLWRTVLKKHANVLMVVSGHTGGLTPIYSYNVGDNGNKVLQVLCDPQIYDAKENEKGEIISGNQDTGLVLYMNFSADGKTINFDYYSTLLNKFLANCDYTINLDSEIDEVGSIDMAGLTQFGQETPLVAEKSKVTLDGAISEGEYSVSKVVPKASLVGGSVGSDLTEYFAYDDDYLYYAFSANIVASAVKLGLHFGSSLYTLKEINSDNHTGKMTVNIATDGSCSQEINEVAAKLRKGDITCSVGKDLKTRRTVYEIKIRRGYLTENSSPSNLLSYTLNIGSTPYNFKLSTEAKEYLKGLGVQNAYSWTYNYAYFGTRPEPVEDAPETTLPESVDTPEGVETDPAAADGGCGSTLTLASVACISVMAFAAVSVTKKKKND